MDYKRGESRGQAVLFPERLDEYIGEESVARFIDAFVESLDLEKLGFERAVLKETGRPPYHPGDLLRLYLYGYLNRLNSSRGLEREAGRNVEVMWLLGKLKPDFKTIADFRRDNGKGIKRVCEEFTKLCKRMNLFGGVVGIDGSKYRAVNSKDKIVTRKKLKEQMKRIEGKVEEYLRKLDEADAEEKDEWRPSKEEMEAMIEGLKKKKEEYQSKEAEMKESRETQMAINDPDARLMKTKEGKNVCYNLQLAVDGKHKLIVAHEITNEENDQRQLFNMAKRAKETLGVEEMEAVADKGYPSGEQVMRCEREGITVYIGEKKKNRKPGIFPKAAFRYRAEDDVYECPAGEEVRYWRTGKRRKLAVRIYKGVACERCPIRSQCTTSRGSRQVKRWPGEDALERMAVRVRGAPEKLKLRGQLVEHPFGTMKRWWGYGQFLTKGLAKVGTESSLMILAYNMRRVQNITGIKNMIEALT